ncbi:hypothetical protein PMM47T1_03909 [Pseudomonas sp. M47T1]|nr:hypothetical protein PMM47T1_03909 [Pseudomonas sp. M47T1]
MAEQTITCEALWAIGQQRAIKLLSDEKECPIKGKSTELISDFGTRAGRIAAAYARFYLELEPGCDPKSKGRFYWMGLAAFASKQVKCGLDFIKVASQIFVDYNNPSATAMVETAKTPLKIGKNSLGKGNFWLFQDIYVWHWFYANHKDLFKSCIADRNTESYPNEIKATLNSLPWAAEALPAIKNLQKTEFIQQGFSQIYTLETTSNHNTIRKLQLSSLMNIADHEQRKILQPLIYNDLSFELLLDTQKVMEAIPGTPKRLASFSDACDIDDSKFKIEMHEGALYRESDRMKFITEIAQQYHTLMDDELEYMENKISIISSWA